MSRTAIIGGSGLDQLQSLEVTRRKVVRTPYGDPSGILKFGELFGSQFVFLPRHGMGHTIPPHKVNYRANIWALKNSNVTEIIAFAAVGGIDSELTPGSIVLPDQIIDYTWAREHTFFDGDADIVHHIDFTHPYSTPLRNRLLDAASKASIDVVDGGTYAATQGPRLETAAEVRRLEEDGATIVGMTGMPEAALARELDLHYACVAIVVNPAAGKAEAEITVESIGQWLDKGTTAALEILKHF